MSSHSSAAKFIRRKGQEEWRTFVRANLNKGTFVAKAPTGYGKTEMIVDAYNIQRELNGINRMLIVVPTETQLSQYCDDLQRKARVMGIAVTGVWPAESTAATIKYHRTNRAEIFVTTVQRIVIAVKGQGRAGNWLDDLMSTGSWMGAADEYHHYANDVIGNPASSTYMGWGQALQKLSHIKLWTAVSATPERKIGNTIFGAPDISISYADGLAEGVLKEVAIRIRDYGADIQSGTLPAERYTTTQLREKLGTEDIDTYEARKQLRYLTNYCSPILVHALSELGLIGIVNAPHVRPQMLIYAYSCRHAKALCEIVQAISPGFTVDWVGTGLDGRTDQENKTIIEQRFKDTYDDNGAVIQMHTLDILIQVNKASEGFDSKPVSVIVDLSLTGFGPQKLQQYGRGTRYYYGLTLVIYVPTDSEIARLAHLMHGIFDEPIDTIIPTLPQEPKGDGPWSPLPTTHVLNAQLIGGEDYDPTREEVIGIAPHIAEEESKRQGIQVQYDPEHNDADFEIIKKALIAYYRKASQDQSTKAAADLWSGKVNRAVGHVARLLILRKDPGNFDRRLFGPYSQRINGKWGADHDYHDAMTDADFIKKYEWLCEIEADILSGRTPAWLSA